MTAFCGHCAKQRSYSKTNRCFACGKIIWELEARACGVGPESEKLRTTNETYRALVRYGDKKGTP